MTWQVVKGRKPGSVYVGRPSVLGNPFVVGVHGNRRECIDKYEVWLRVSILDHNSDQYKEINRLASLSDGELSCHCYPLPCHADVIAKIIDEVRRGEHAM